MHLVLLKRQRKAEIDLMHTGDKSADPVAFFWINCSSIHYVLLLLYARVPEADGGALLVSALRGWGHNFFQCEVCQ